MKKSLLLFNLIVILFVNSQTNAQVPTVSSFLPASGPVGTVVTITGTNFSTTNTNNIVWFGATKATVTSSTSTQLIVTVPVGATYKPISVTIGGLTGSSKSPFIVTFTGSTSIDANSFAGNVNFSTVMYPTMSDLVDIDGDGKSDIATSGNNNYILSIFRNTSSAGSITTGSLASKVDLTTYGPSSFEVTFADIDGDGKQDLLLTNTTFNTLSIYRNISSSGSISAGSFATRVDFTTGVTPTGVAAADFDGDGKTDIVVANGGSNTISIFRNTSIMGAISAGSLSSKTDFQTGNDPNGVVATDIDGDGKIDIIVNNAVGNSISVFRNTSITGSITASSFSTKVDFATGNDPFFITSGDIDGDNKPDIAVNNASDNTISVFRNTSTVGSITSSSFNVKVDFPTTYAPQMIGIGDLNGDGKPELVVTNGIISVYQNTSTPGTITSGSFAPRVDFSTDTSPIGIKIGDIDGDGKPDILTTNSFGSISILRNKISDVLPLPATPAANAPSSVSQTSFNANWSSSATATGYYLDVATDDTFTSFVIGFNNKDAGNVTSLGVTGLTASTDYYYRVRAYNASGTSISSNTSKATTLPNSPVSPIANEPVTITSTGFTAIWNSSPTATGYFLDVATDEGFSSFVIGYSNHQVGNVTSQVVTSLNSNTNYYYRVRASNSGGDSPNSNTILVTTLSNQPAAPTGLKASSCNDEIKLIWDPNTETGFLRYIIFGGPSQNPITRIDSTSDNISETTKILTGLTHGQKYYFRIKAVVTPGIEGPYSNEVNAVVSTGYIPKIKIKWEDVLVCYNLDDSITSYQWCKGSEAISGANKQYFVSGKQSGIYKVETIDKDGCLNSSNEITLLGTKSISVYPNPAGKRIFVNLNDEPTGKVIISIINTSGVTVSEFRTEKEEQILSFEMPVNDLEDGIYLLRVSVNQTFNYYFKVVISKK